MLYYIGILAVAHHCQTNMIPIFVIALGVTMTVLVITLITQRSKNTKPNKLKLPPGISGWPLIGETLPFISSPAKFFHDRMSINNSPEVFQTSIGGDKIAVFCTPEANKFIFANDEKLFKFYLPRSMTDVLSYPFTNKESHSGRAASDAVFRFLRVENLKYFVDTVDFIVQQHLDEFWFGKTEVKVFPLMEKLTFALSCKVFTNPTKDQLENLEKPFNDMIKGIISLPINFPGTNYYNGVKNSKRVKELLIEMMKDRRKEIKYEKVDFIDGCIKHKKLDFLSRYIVESSDELSSDEDLGGQIIGIIFAGFYPTYSTLSFAIGNLADHPDVYDKVLQEQLAIAKAKGSEEPLTWDDIQKMKYTWMVICETMRIIPPSPANFRTVLSDFTYGGYTIPKEWKVLWSQHTTNKDPKYFSNPDKFDPSRFEGNGATPYACLPFGARPGICAGKEFARIEMLVCLHNLVTKFKFKRVDLEEKIIHYSVPTSTQGVRIYLEPRKF